MSSITSGVGLLSGLPVNDLVDSMLAGQRRPITLLQDRLESLSKQRTAFLKISANLLAVLNSASKFKNASFFQAAKATSSDEKSVIATASPGAAVGQFQITVKSLAASHQIISAGFTSADATPVGAGTLTIESSQALLNRSTRLSSLRGGEGVDAGKIQLTDRLGGSAVIDLANAVSIDDVVGAINVQSTAKVKAQVAGDHLVLTDQTGAAVGNLAIAEVGSGHSAEQLGILGTSSSGVVTGLDLVSISTATRIDELNDGNGVRRLTGAPDFSVSLSDGTSLEFSISDRLQLDTSLSQLNSGAGVPAGKIHIKARSGAEADVDLTAAQTILDVKNAIEASGLGVNVSLGPGGLVLHDGSTGDKAFAVSEVNGGSTAKALGILGTATSTDINGKKVLFVDSLADVLRVINTKSGNSGKLTASIAADGKGIQLTDNTAGAGTFQVTALNGSKTAEDLGLLTASAGNTLTGRRVVAGLDSVLLRSLRGGTGAIGGVIQITDRAGASANVDLTGATSLSQVIEAINSAGTGVRASVTANGLSLRLTDATGGVGNLKVTDVSGMFAADLGIAIDQSGATFTTANLQKQYVSAATRLNTLRGGAGVPPGKFRITDSAGATAVVDLTQGNEERVQDVIDEINSRGIGIAASINATGDGILLTDTAGGAGKLKVTEEGGTTAKALGILGEAATGQTTLDGSFEARIQITGGDTLQDVTAKIKATSAPVFVTILHDAVGARPYRLSLTSAQSGWDGALAIDSGTTGFALSDLVRARDASVIFGPPDADAPLVLHSATNTLTDAVSNVRLDLINTSSTATTVSINEDTASITKDLNLFVSAMNTALGAIDDLTRFDDKTNARSVLTGDPTIRGVRDRLIDLVNRTVPGLSAPLNRLSAIGIELADGNSVRFDEAKFTKAYAQDPAAVQALFTTTKVGLGFAIESDLKRLTDTGTGVLSTQDENIQKSEDLLNQRITQLQTLVDSRRLRLLAQFSATEQAIAKLQSQQTALSSISAVSRGF